ncbi:MAG: YdcF family protein [Stellaceae bacterium]
MLKWISYSCLIPPNIFILLAMIGVILAWRWRRTGLVLATAAVACLYLAATPLAGFLLIRSAEALAGVIPKPRLPAPPGAIVVLSGDYRPGSLPGEKDTVGPLTLERLAEGVREQRRLGLPILVSGGWVGKADDSLAGMMAAALRDDFRVPVRWREERSRTTYQNARDSAAILRRAGVPAAVVVTNPWHMARALWSFRAVGYPVVPAPTPDGRSLARSPSVLLPQVPALLDSYYALHEMIGLAWYVCRYGHW